MYQHISDYQVPRIHEKLTRIGTQVVYSFLVTGWMVVALLIVYYCSVFDPRLDPFRSPTATGSQRACSIPNPVDIVILGSLRKVGGLILDFLCKWKRLRWIRSVKWPARDDMESTLNKVRTSGAMSARLTQLQSNRDEYHM